MSTGIVAPRTQMAPTIHNSAAAFQSLLIANARECFVEVGADGARRGLLVVAVPPEYRDRILRWLRQRVLPGVFGLRPFTASRAHSVTADVPNPFPRAEYQRYIGRWFVEVAHAPIA